MLALSTVILSQAQTLLTLEECRDMAVKASRDLNQADLERQMAGYDKQIARASYFPNVSALGGYIHNSRDIALISDTQSQMLTNAGTLVQNSLNQAAADAAGQMSAALTQKMTQLMTAIQTNPALAAEYMGSPMWQTVMQIISGVDPQSLAGLVPDISEPINAIGRDIDNALHPDMRNIIAGAVTVQQPLFAGGKIVYYNQIASLARQLSDAKYDMKYADVVLDVDQAYWQIVSISDKARLAEAYSELLHQMEHEASLAVREGVATESDILQIKVKVNEAELLKLRSGNGLSLAKMLLCKRIGLPLESDITLADESLESVPLPQIGAGKDIEDIYSDRPETRSLALAGEIYDRKAKIVRSEMLPSIALMGNYLISNPNVFNGFQNNFDSGMFSAGVVVKVPICHGGENLFRYKKARAEAKIYEEQLEDAKEMIALQVAQQRKLLDEALEKLAMTRSALDNAEENLRKADLGFKAGVVETNTVLAAHTAWLSAHSEYIDAGVEVQMAAATLEKAEGYRTDNK